MNKKNHKINNEIKTNEVNDDLELSDNQYDNESQQKELYRCDETGNYIDSEDNIYEEEPIPYEEESAKRGFFLSTLSIDEKRLSVLIICLLLCIIFGGVNYVLVGDITANLTNIIVTLIYAIAGVNITSSIVNSIGKNGEKNEMIVHAKEYIGNKCKKLKLRKINKNN